MSEVYPEFLHAIVSLILCRKTEKYLIYWCNISSPDTLGTKLILGSFLQTLPLLLKMVLLLSIPIHIEM